MARQYVNQRGNVANTALTFPLTTSQSFSRA
jgi:hypothetical protein